MRLKCRMLLVQTFQYAFLSYQVIKYTLSAEAGQVYEKFYDRNEDLYEQMERDGKLKVLGMIGKSSVSSKQEWICTLYHILQIHFWM